jgi:hypothetical protein
MTNDDENGIDKLKLEMRTLFLRNMMCNGATSSGLRLQQLIPGEFDPYSVSK